MTDLGAKKDRAAAAGTESKQAEPKFTRQQVLESARYKGRRDLVSALLDGSRRYTVAEVDRMVDQFMKGKVR